MQPTPPSDWLINIQHFPFPQKGNNFSPSLLTHTHIVHDPLADDFAALAASKWLFVATLNAPKRIKCVRDATDFLSFFAQHFFPPRRQE